MRLAPLNDSSSGRASALHGKSGPGLERSGSAVECVCRGVYRVAMRACDCLPGAFLHFFHTVKTLSNIFFDPLSQAYRPREIDMTP